MIRCSRFLVLLFAFLSCSQEAQSPDSNICSEKFSFASEAKLAEFPIDKVLVEIGKSFRGTEYEAHTLEAGDEESLITNLSGLDCYTFIEASLALARCIKLKKTDYQQFMHQIEKIRYRAGQMTDYASRLHYFSDWVWDNSKRGIVKNITHDIGGIRYQNIVNFMSKHPKSYKRLYKAPHLVKAVANIENEISGREYYLIPQERITAVEPKIQSGDIIGITTDITGLDIAHTGMAIRMEDGRIHLLHAPNVGRKVQISDQPLADYVNSNSKQTGIMVARALEPK